MSQINVNPPGNRDSGLASVLAVVVILLVLAVLVWAIAFGGFGVLTSGRAVAPVTANAPPAQSNTTVNIDPKVNVQVPSGAPAKP
jgi:hypothetical protein